MIVYLDVKYGTNSVYFLNLIFFIFIIVEIICNIILYDRKNIFRLVLLERNCKDKQAGMSSQFVITYGQVSVICSQYQTTSSVERRKWSGHSILKNPRNNKIKRFAEESWRQWNTQISILTLNQHVHNSASP